VVESGHGGEVLGGDVRSIVLANEGVGVGGVSNNDGLGITGAVVIDGLADIDEDLSVILEEIATLHAGSAGLGSNKEVVVDILEGGGKIGGDHDIVEKREGAIVELSLDSLENLLLEGQIQEVENLTGNYVGAMGAYRAFYILNWIYRYFAEDYVNVVGWIGGLVQTGLYCDFFYYYAKSKWYGNKLVLPVSGDAA